MPEFGRYGVRDPLPPPQMLFREGSATGWANQISCPATGIDWYILLFREHATSSRPPLRSLAKCLYVRGSGHLSVQEVRCTSGKLVSVMTFLLFQRRVLCGMRLIVLPISRTWLDTLPVACHQH